MNPTPKRIEITVSPRGECRLETLGFVGSTCLEASRLIERALGRATTERLTSEFYADEPARVRQRE